MNHFVHMDDAQLATAIVKLERFCAELQRCSTEIAAKLLASYDAQLTAARREHSLRLANMQSAAQAVEFWNDNEAKRSS